MNQVKFKFWSLLCGTLAAGLVSPSGVASHGDTTGGRFLVVQGEIEGTPIKLQGYNAADVERDCDEFYRYYGRGLSQMVDNISISVNGTQRLDLRKTSGYWRSQEEVCGVISFAVANTREADPYARLQVNALIESEPVQILGSDAREIQDRCMNLARFNGFSTSLVDSIQLSINGRSHGQINKRLGFWRTADEICGVIGDAVENSSDGNPYARITVTGSIENTAFQFRASSLLDLQNRCIDFHRAQGLGSMVDEMEISVNRGPIERIRNRHSFWRTADEVCGVLVNSAKYSSPGRIEPPRGLPGYDPRPPRRPGPGYPGYPGHRDGRDRHSMEGGHVEIYR